MGFLKNKFRDMTSEAAVAVAWAAGKSGRGPLCADMAETSGVTVFSEHGGKETQHGNDKRFCLACNTNTGDVDVRLSLR